MIDEYFFYQSIKDDLRHITRFRKLQLLNWLSTTRYWTKFRFRFLVNLLKTKIVTTLKPVMVLPLLKSFVGGKTQKKPCLFIFSSCNQTMTGSGSALLCYAIKYRRLPMNIEKQQENTKENTKLIKIDFLTNSGDL